MKTECDKNSIYWRSDNKYKYRNIHFGELRKMLVSLEDDPYNVLSKKSMVEQLYNTFTYVKQITIQEEINILKRKSNLYYCEFVRWNEEPVQTWLLPDERRRVELSEERAERAVSRMLTPNLPPSVAHLNL